MKGFRLLDGRGRLACHGPERRVQTGVDRVAVQRARLRDRGIAGADEAMCFTSFVLPRWPRRTLSLDALLPILYLRGVLIGDFRRLLVPCWARGTQTCRFR